MALPVVAIVGRPNVGKSSIFNWLAGRKISIVDPTAGVTRDRISTIVEADDRQFELVDTGGMGIQDMDNLTEDVERQIRIAINEASVVLFTVDIKDGVVPLDEIVAERLRLVTSPVILVANKADDEKYESNATDFYRLGYGEPLIVSAEQRLNQFDLLDAIVEKLPEHDGQEKVSLETDLKVALVGKRNVGKSTMLNSWAETERVIVSEVAGTTRDSIDVRIERDGKAILAIDTAGVRKRKSLASDIEFYSLHRAERSIRRADVVLHLFDPRYKISRVDKQLAEYIYDNHKPAIFVVNKWDLAKDRIATEKWGDYLQKIFPMLSHVPVVFTTATEGRNVYRLLNLAQTLHKQAGNRMKTGLLNRVIRDALAVKSPPLRQNRIPKVFYAAQIAAHPPTITLVTNGPDLFDPPYVRFMLKTIRDASPFPEVTIRLLLKAKSDPGLVKFGLHDKIDESADVQVDTANDDVSNEMPIDPVPKATEPPPVRKSKKQREPGTWDI